MTFAVIVYNGTHTVSSVLGGWVFVTFDIIVYLCYFMSSVEVKTYEILLERDHQTPKPQNFCTIFIQAHAHHFFDELLVVSKLQIYHGNWPINSTNGGSCVCKFWIQSVQWLRRRSLHVKYGDAGTSACCRPKTDETTVDWLSPAKWGYWYPYRIANVD